MPGRIVYADVPHAPASPDWLAPLYLAGNAAVFALNAAPTLTARVRWRGAIEAILATQRPSWRPIVYLAWHRYNYASVAAMRALPEAIRPTLVMHDGIASRALTHRSSAWLGFETLVFRRRSLVPPREQMIAYARRERRHLFVLPDAGGPYLRMKPGALEVAARLHAWIQPLAFRCRPALTVGRALRHVVPLPFSAVEVRAGPMLDAGAASLEDCQRALDVLERDAR